MKYIKKKIIIKYNANTNFSEKIFHCDFEKRNI